MNLLEIRKEFVRKSGRYDLVQNDDESFQDAGADFFIRAGQRMLDRKGDWNTGQRANFLAGLESGQSEFFIENCWWVQKLLWQVPGMHDWEEAVQVHDVRKGLCCRTLGTLYFSLVPTRDLPKIGDKLAGEINQPASAFDMAADRFGEEYFSGLRFRIAPRFHTPSTFRVVGNFYSEPLTEDSSTNFWSVRHPDILLKAALYELEVFYRNSEGAKDWLNAVMVDMQDIAETELLAEVGGPMEMGL